MESLFNKYGDKTIFFSRFIPLVRHLISISAGIGEMKPGQLILYTAIGAAMWNSILAYAGFKQESHWNELRHYDQTIDSIVAVMLLAGLGYFVYNHIKRLKDSKAW